MMKFLRFSLAAMVLSAALAAAPADFGGLWIAKYQVRGRMMEMSFQLGVSKDVVTGTANILNANMLPISNGKIDGNKISFDVRFDYDPDVGHDILQFNGTLVGDTLQLTRTTKGKPGSQKLVATKSSSKR